MKFPYFEVPQIVAKRNKIQTSLEVLLERRWRKSSFAAVEVGDCEAKLLAYPSLADSASRSTYEQKILKNTEK